jgi:hypothetical protein
MIAEIWLSIHITGGDYQEFVANAYPTKEACLESLHIPEKDWPSWGHGTWNYKKATINGVCFKVEDAVVTMPDSWQKQWGVE